MKRVRVLNALDAGNYQRSILHTEDRIWGEKNCYVDIWIELVHALGLEPRAMLPFVVELDFLGDQWTFFKPPHEEIRTLYGIDVQELNVWRPLFDHALEHLAAGRLISTEADAFWLPDTHGTDYRSQHTKTTIIIENVDPDAGVLGYFHNAAYYRLDGEDFRQIFRLDAPRDPTFMPLFAEILTIDRLVRHDPADLASQSLRCLKRHFERRPTGNPMLRFRERFLRDLPGLQALGLNHYHAWAFATIRQLGAAAELAAINFEWLAAETGAGLLESAQSFQRIAANSKTLILKSARAVMTKKDFDFQPIFSELVADWAHGFTLLGKQLN